MKITRKDVSRFLDGYDIGEAKAAVIRAARDKMLKEMTVTGFLTGLAKDLPSAKKHEDKT
jgi:hypothetical protein